MKTWKSRVRAVWASLAELKEYDRIYGVAKRCGYQTAARMWQENPVVGGSTNPKDFGKVRA